MEINLLELYRDWYRICIPDGANRALADDDINLGLLKIKAKQCTWKTVTNKKNTISRPVRMIKDQRSTNSTGTGLVHATRTCEKKMQVLIETGVVKGINRYMSLPLDRNLKVVTDNFGPHLEINPSKTFSDLTESKMKLAVGMEQSLGSQGDLATITCNQHEYKGTFTAKVAIKGVVPSRSGLQQTLADMLKQLRDSGFYNSRQEQANLEIVGGAVVIQMTGEVELEWESDHTYEWQ